MPIKFNRLLPCADKYDMRKILFLCLHFLCLSLAFAQTKPLYRLPETLPPQPLNTSESGIPFLVGTDSGLYKVSPNGFSECIWSEGRVERLIRTQNLWYFVTDKGILRSNDLKSFTECNKGLPKLIKKTYNGTEKHLVQEVPLLKDLCADPFDEQILVTATKDEVYLTRDGGDNWTSIGSMSRYTAGMKAVACAHMPIYDKSGIMEGNELVVFMSHPIYGFSYYRADAKKPAWVDVSAGFSAMPSLTQPDEVSDILPVVVRENDGSLRCDIYLANTFLPNIYRFDWKGKRAVKVYTGSEAVDTIDALCQSNGSLLFTTVGNVSAINLDTGSEIEMPPSYKNWRQMLSAPLSPINTSYVPAEMSGFGTPLILSELWLLNPDRPLSPWGGKATGKKAIYASAYQLRNDTGIAKYRKIVTDNKLNAMVVDMKDDYGYLRFEPKNEMLKDKGAVTAYKIDVEKMVSAFKEDGTYLIARIVVFKDKNLAMYKGGKYAVWDRNNKKPWIGVRGSEDIMDENGTAVIGTRTLYYDENWVDPYSEEVWEYNIEIAQELVDRGFDEIQFDYIRFPTDGTNMGDAAYRWKDAGMDKESALVSFLSYARENIKAPIGIDIYGANGWYRSGTRTGQDVELMSQYVDVICPMFYPSHFEQNFLEYPPVRERPYRIYFYGTYRNTIAGRNRIIVRPWVQAFYMGVRYDRQYYDKNYVLREIYGVRDSVNRGYMYWNNSGGMYDDISPDVGNDQLSPWKEQESDLQQRRPAFSTGSNAGVKTDEVSIISRALSHQKDMISILDSMLAKEHELELEARQRIRLLHVTPFFTMKE